MPLQGVVVPNESGVNSTAAERNDTNVNPSPPQPALEATQDDLRPTAQDLNITPLKVQAEEANTIEAANEHSTPQSAHTEDAATTSAPSHQPTQACEPSTEQDTSLRQPTLQTSRTDGVGNRCSQIQSHVAFLRIVRDPVERHKDATGHPSERPQSDALGQIAAPTLPDFELMFDDMDDVEDFIRQSQTLRAQRHSTIMTRQSQVKETGLALRLQQAQRQIMLLKQHIQTVDSNSPERENEGAEHALPLDKENSGGENEDDDSEGAQEIGKTAGPQTRVVTAATYNKLQKEFMVRQPIMMHECRCYLTHWFRTCRPKRS